MNESGKYCSKVADAIPHAAGTGCCRSPDREGVRGLLSTARGRGGPLPSWASFALIALALLVPGMISPVHGASDRIAIKVDTLETGDMIVRFEKPLSNAAMEIVRLFPKARDDLAALLGWVVLVRPEVVLIQNHRTFEMLARSEMVVAFADPRRHLIVIDCSRVGMPPFDLDATFKHELCHLLLHAHIPAGLPKWLDEGVAQWASGGLAEILMDNRASVLREAALAGRLFRFDDLSARFPEDRYGLILAYEQSRSLVEYIADTYGTPNLLRLLSTLEKGNTIDDAAQKNLGLTMAALEGEWASHLGGRLGWLVYVSNNLYEILFFLASLITVVAVVRTIVRRVARRSSREEDEG